MHRMRRLGSLAFILLAAAGARADDLPSFRITANNGTLQPLELLVPARQRIKLEIINESSEPIEFESLELRKEKVLAPGASSFVVIAPLRPGAYQFFDEFHPETSQGVLIAE